MNDIILPRIIIKDAWLLRENASKHLHELWAEDGQELADHNRMHKIVSKYKNAWKPKEKQILEGMCNILELEFAHNIIDVYIAPWFSAFSDPLIIGVKFEPDQFVDILSHELFHRLLTANTSINIEDNNRIVNWKKMFGDNHSHKTLVHIPVHACSKALYLDVMKEPGRLERDIEECEQWPDYKAAWEYVQKNDYKEIISQLKDSYKN